MKEIFSRKTKSRDKMQFVVSKYNAIGVWKSKINVMKNNFRQSRVPLNLTNDNENDNISAESKDIYGKQ